MLEIFLAVGIIVFVVGVVHFLATDVERGERRMFIGFVVVVVSIIVMVWQAVDAKNDRARRTVVYIGSPIELSKENEGTEKCLQSFKLKWRDEDSYKRLPYTFEVDCDTVLRHGDVLRITFIAPKEDSGKPEILEPLNFTLKTEEYSRPHSFPPAEAPAN